MKTSWASKSKSSSRALIVFVTVPTRSDAVRIATRVIERGLAACANVVPGVTSIYVWKGRLERGKEVLVLFKTTKNRYKRLETTIKKLHSYEVPEVIGVRLDSGLRQYLAWISHSVSISRGRSRRSSPR